MRTLGAAVDVGRCCCCFVYHSLKKKWGGKSPNQTALINPRLKLLISIISNKTEEIINSNGEKQWWEKQPVYAIKLHICENDMCTSQVGFREENARNIGNFSASFRAPMLS